MRRAVVFCAAIALSACASYDEERLSNDIAALEAKASCCKSLAEIAPQPIAFGEPVSVALSNESPVYDFEAGRSYFVAFELPRWEAPYSVWLTGGAVSGRALHRFVPTAMILDSSFRSTRQIKANTTGVQQDARRSLQFFVNASNRDEKYLVIYSEGLFNRRGYTQRGIATANAMIGYVAVPIGAAELAQRIHHSPVGPISVELRPYVPRRHGEAVGPN